MQYLSVKEATSATGLSDASIRRLCKGLSKPNIKYQSGKLFILDTFLFSKYPPQNLLKQDDEMPSHLPKQMPRQQNLDPELIQDLLKEYPARLLIEKDKTIELLQGEIEIKNRQLEKKDLIIRELNTSNQLVNERLRETNINLQTLQQGLNQMLKQLPQNNQEQRKTINQPSITNKVLYAMALITTLCVTLLLAAVIYNYLKNR